MIAPARQFTYPLAIAGEEEAMARGALYLMVTPETGGTFLALCALGFKSAALPTGVFACPDPNALCAVAGGYAYVIDTRDPCTCTLIAMKPVAQVWVAAEMELLLFVGFHSVIAWGVGELAWESGRLSWEGVQIEAIEGSTLRGSGWNMATDKDVAFVLDLKTGTHTGGGYL